jgi:protein-S-isoprenylcysteine O-methyltransferase
MFTTVFTTVFVLWGLSEVGISTFFRSEMKGGTDAGTLKLVLIAAYASIGVATYLAIADDGVLAKPAPAGYVGLAMLLLGMLIRAYAIVTLRRFFTVNVTVRDDHRLIRTGPYRFVRHPSYTGALLSFYGFALALQNGWASLVVSVPVTYAFFVRMRVEEAVLRSAFPEEYPAYERQTRRLVRFLY